MVNIWYDITFIIKASAGYNLIKHGKYSADALIVDTDC